MDSWLSFWSRHFDRGPQRSSAYQLGEAAEASSFFLTWRPDGNWWKEVKRVSRDCRDIDRVLCRFPSGSHSTQLGVSQGLCQDRMSSLSGTREMLSSQRRRLLWPLGQQEWICHIPDGSSCLKVHTEYTS